MSSGRSDWSQLTVISGKYGSSYLPVLLDSAGQLFAIFKGTDGTSYIPIKLDADGNLVARIKGMAGSTITDVKVDPDGQMYVRIMGLDGVTQRQLAVDSDGNIVAQMKGVKADLTLKTIAVDDSGIMKANLAAQDLSYLKVRPTYGGMRAIAYATKSCAASGLTTLDTITGSGTLMGGFIQVEDNALSAGSYLRLEVDATYVCDLLFWIAYNYPIWAKGNFPLAPMVWRGDGYSSSFSLKGPILFDTKLMIQFYNVYASVKDVSYFFTYAFTA